MKYLFCFITLASAVFGQTPRSVTLNWADTINPVATVYNVYRSTGACSVSSVFAKIASNLTAKTYTDTTVQPGIYCYYATSFLNTLESVASMQTQATVSVATPVTLTNTPQ